MSFDEVYARYADCVYSFLRFKLNDEYLIEEIMQETFLAVYRSLDKCKNVQSAKEWILTIAHHKLVDHLRRAKHKEVALDQNIRVEESPSDLTIKEILSQLDAVSATIIYGLYVEQFTCEELAGILGIPVGTVKSKAYTARARLRSWLKGVEQ